VGDAPSSAPSLRIVGGEVQARTTTSRTVIPTAAQSAWPPFRRVAEVIATVDRKLPAHGHEGEEVLTYGIEGSASVAVGGTPPKPLQAHTVVLLTAPGKAIHAISPAEGSTVRWFSVVVGLASPATGDTRVQWGRPPAGDPQPDGTVVRRLVGPGSGVTSTARLEGEAIEFLSEGTTFRRVGRDRRAVVYALSGRGRVDGQAIEQGEAALVENYSGLGLQGHPGFRAVLVVAPRPSGASAGNLPAAQPLKPRSTQS
jgi:redox-sensitive bicupin YhaK (pirin superfamily)